MSFGILLRCDMATPTLPPCPVIATECGDSGFAMRVAAKELHKEARRQGWVYENYGPKGGRKIGWICKECQSA